MRRGARAGRNASDVDLSADTGVPADQTWATYRFSFTATAVGSTIVLQNTGLSSDDCCAPIVDDVRVVRIPLFVRRLQ